MMFTMQFWKQVAERAFKSAAQAAVGAMLLDSPVDIFNATLLRVLGIAGGAAVLSVLTSLASYSASPRGTPSLVDPMPAPESFGGGRHEGQ